ncbi:MAG: tetratricopeptide repeat protein [Desulfovibrionaceae bacterium]
MLQRTGCIAVVMCMLAMAAGAWAHELPRVLIQRGERFLAMGKLDAAIANYSQVIACCEGTAEAAEAHNDLGVAYVRKGDHARAVAEYRKALEGGGYPLAHFNLGKALRDEAAQASATAQREQLRTASRQEFQTFLQWLRSDALKPTVVTYQQPEIEAYVEEALRELR